MMLERPDLLDLVPFGNHHVCAEVPGVPADLAPPVPGLRLSQLSDCGQIALEPVAVGLIGQNET